MLKMDEVVKLAPTKIYLYVKQQDKIYLLPWVYVPPCETEGRLQNV